MSYIFTADWFSNSIPVWEKYLAEYKGMENLNFLEIGSYEGRSSVWLLENILIHPTSKLHCIDLFDPYAIDNDMSSDPTLNLNYYNTFLNNINNFKDRVVVHKGYSYMKLREYKEEEVFDVVYIDGAHTAYEVLLDCAHSEPLLKVGGLMILDDYELGSSQENKPEFAPKMGVNAFCSVFKNQYEIVYKGWQLILRKTNNIHIW